MKSKTLPAIRIDNQTDSNIQAAIKKINKASVVEITLQDFRRLSYEYFTQQILKSDNLKQLLQLQ